ncbi:hypothetical protein LB941_07295 [Ligilactobacillus sp. WILCCON 0076]|uniref:Uncharacterized protein n=1 Tax=Ligilactobacillus ubinensis TaxID=2876789 RepID=A0A9X2FMJ9_9LACO|nr:hypothetical protein [Ligilactobacillus ubinensis]MCP0887138.1 hypothetical protein [Ligilactobacillus ubinensis]
MAKDGTQRGGRRARSGERSQPLVDKVATGKKATRMEFELPDVELLVGENFVIVSPTTI